MKNDTDLIEELAKQIDNPTTVVISRDRYEALCLDYTPRTKDDVFETIVVKQIVTNSGTLDIQVTDSKDSTLAVR